ncbi:MAG: hypothetical protein OER88_12750 [Planctomycetota bacterium]|nr:hypothetical protein [Planctomycetota bacterium]
MGTRLAALLLCAAVAHADPRLSDVDPKVRVNAVPSAPLAALLECLHDRDPAVREAALHVVASREDAYEAAGKYLRRPLLRRETFEAAARIDPVAAGDSVLADPSLLAILDERRDGTLRKLFAHPSWRVREAVVEHEHVRKQATGGWLQLLATAAANDPAHAVRYRALRLLVRKRSAATLPALSGLINDSEVRIRALSWYGLSRLKADAATIAAVLPKLKDEAPAVRARAVYVLRGDRRHAAAIEPLLGDPDVRATVVAVLAHMGVWRDDIAPELLAAALRVDADAPYRRRNLRAGATVGHAAVSFPSTDRLARKAFLAAKKKAVPHVVRAFERERAPVARGSLVEVLWALEAKGPLRAALGDSALYVRRCAAFCLVDLGVVEKLPLRIVVESIASKEWDLPAKELLELLELSDEMERYLDRFRKR